MAHVTPTNQGCHNRSTTAYCNRVQPLGTRDNTVSGTTRIPIRKSKTWKATPAGPAQAVILSSQVDFQLRTGQVNAFANSGSFFVQTHLQSISPGFLAWLFTNFDFVTKSEQTMLALRRLVSRWSSPALAAHSDCTRQKFKFETGSQSLSLIWCAITKCARSLPESPSAAYSNRTVRPGPLASYGNRCSELSKSARKRLRQFDG